MTEIDKGLSKSGILWKEADFMRGRNHHKGMTGFFWRQRERN